MKYERYIIAGIIILALAAVIAVGFNDRTIYTLPTSLDSNVRFNTSGGFVGVGLSVAKTGTFNNRGEGFVGRGLRGPGYVSFLALSFLIFGEYTWSVYLINFIFLAIALYLLWRISQYYVSGYFVFVPSLMLALYPLSAQQVYGGYEPFTIFLLTLSLFALLKYSSTQKIRFLIISAVSLSIWALERPIFLYFLPVVFMLLILWQWSTVPKKRFMIHMIVFSFIIFFIIGSWSFRNHRVLGTWQLGSGGHILLRPATQVDFSSEDLISAALSYAVGDFIGSRIYSHFPKNAEVKAWDPSVEQRFLYKEGWIVQDNDGEVLTKAELDKKMYREATSKIKQHPMKFLLTGFIRLLRLNGPVNHRSLEIMSLFMGTNMNLSIGLKISIIVIIRLVWFSFLALVLFGIVRHSKDWRLWGIIALLILYYNGTHALLTHGEARYLLTVMPLYFLFFASSVQFLGVKFGFNSDPSAR